MRRQRLLTITLVSFLLLFLTVICANASWFIQDKNQSSQASKTSTPAAGSEYFKTEYTYTGSKIEHAYKNSTGSALFGDISGLSFQLTGATPFSGNFNLLNGENVSEIYAGTYTYTVTEKATGQVICEGLKITIKQRQLSYANVTASSMAFEDEQVTYTYDLVYTKDDGTTATYSSKETASFTASSSAFTAATTTAPTAQTNTSHTVSPNYTIPSQITVGGSSTANPAYNNYLAPASASLPITIQVLPKCYAYNGSSATFYGSLDDALAATVNQSTTIVAMQSFKVGSTTYSATGATAGNYTHTITGGTEDNPAVIGAGVTLMIPFRPSTKFDATEEGIRATDRHAVDANDDLIVDDDGDADGNLSAYDSNFKATPTCANEVLLTGKLVNNGHIQIAGITGAPIPTSTTGIRQASTTGKHGTLTMTNASLLMNSGNPTLTVHGYIANGGNSSLEAKKGTITMPFVVYDYGGGGTTVALFKGSGGIFSISRNEPNVSPFTAFDMPNIQVKMTCYGGSSGATIKAVTSLFTNTVTGFESMLPPKYNTTSFNMFGNSNALFNMKNGYATFHYNYEGIASYAYTKSGYIPPRNARTEIVLKGETVSGDLAMSIYVPIVGNVNVSLSSVKFPVCDKIKLHLTGDYTYTFTSPYKFLPGSELYIQGGADVIVNASSGLLFYETLDDSYGLYSAHYNHAKANTPAVCQISDGSLSVVGALGGTVYATGKDVVFDLSNATLEMTEVEGIGDNEGTDFTFTTKQTVNLKAKGYTSDGTTTSSSPVELGNNGYYSLNSSNYPWRAGTPYTITLNGNGGKYNGADTTTASVFLDADGYMITSVDGLKHPILDGQRVNGWATTPTGNAVSSSDIRVDVANNQNVVLYALWRPAVSANITYNVTPPTEGDIIGTYPGYTRNDSENGTIWVEDGFFTVDLETTYSKTNTTHNQFVAGWTATWSITTEDGVIHTLTAPYIVGDSVDVNMVLKLAGIPDATTVTACSATLTPVWTAKHTFTYAVKNKTGFMCSTNFSISINSDITISSNSSGTYYISPIYDTSITGKYSGYSGLQKLNLNLNVTGDGAQSFSGTGSGVLTDIPIVAGGYTNLEINQ